MRHGTLIKTTLVIAAFLAVASCFLANVADEASNGAANVRAAMKAGEAAETEQIRRLFLKMLGEKCTDNGKTVDNRGTCI